MLEEIEEEIRHCRKCPLWKGRTHAVPGEGDESAQLMIVGEAPGKREDEMGRPFVGKAGQLLREVLERNSLRREEIYITNVVKCRPPNNRNPSSDEIKKCIPYLHRQMDTIAPCIIVTLGNVATSSLLPLFGFIPEKISIIHGTIFESALHRVTIVPTFHPAACIYNPALKQDFIRDFERVGAMLRSTRGGRKI